MPAQKIVSNSLLIFNSLYRTYSRDNISIGIPLATGIYLRGAARGLRKMG